MTETPTLVAVAHGTQNPNGLATVQRLMNVVRTKRPGLPVELCWLEAAEPSLASLLPGIEGPVVIVPLLLSTGYHVRVDIPAVIGDRARTAIGRPLGPDPRIARALLDRLRQVMSHEHPTSQVAVAALAQAGDDIVLLASGSSDPAAADEIAEVGRQLEQLVNGRVLTRVLSDEQWYLGVPDGSYVANYLLAPGYFNDRVHVEAREIWSAGVAEPLGAHPLVADVILDRYDAAAAGL
ncbi:MAG: putative cbiX family protein [Frankiales bacterium]|nr:putative cbiX family protein [Frankiales bacterium]